MASHQNLSKYQQGIVRRYYDHHDTIHLTKLMELVSELAVATEAKAAGKLWTRVETALKQTDVPAATAAAVVAGRDVKQLAELVAKLAKASKP
jgi:hypothetical protein